jgi:hypothetical protein
MHRVWHKALEESPSEFQLHHAWWCTSIIPALESHKQEDGEAAVAVQ